jgi:hypothetical protein
MPHHCSELNVSVDGDGSDKKTRKKRLEATG